MNEHLKLITEDIFEDYEILFEQQNETSPKFIRVKGPYIVTETKNGNGRIYSRPLMEAAVKQYNDVYIKQKRAYGELNHPTTTMIEPKNACDLCVSLTQKDNVWFGESVILSSDEKHGIKGTPNGDITASLLQHGGKIGKSTRGVGQVDKNTNRVDSVFKLIAHDTVLDPSGPGCFVDGIFESKNFMINQHGDIVEVAFDNYKKGLEVIPTHSVKTDEGKLYVESLFKKFIIDINNLSQIKGN